uniref:PID domain-containing protein n=1 Tax=Sphenodon punctatus TaxID=8508 RepID=A0A8D0GLA4_SPHPU
MREPLLEGMGFALKYLGMTLVEKPKGEEMAAAAIRRITSMARVGAKKFQKVILTVSPRGISLQDAETLEMIENVSIYRLQAGTAPWAPLPHEEHQAGQCQPASHRPCGQPPLQAAFWGIVCGTFPLSPVQPMQVPQAREQGSGGLQESRPRISPHTGSVMLGRGAPVPCAWLPRCCWDVTGSAPRNTTILVPF